MYNIGAHDNHKLLSYHDNEPLRYDYHTIDIIRGDDFQLAFTQIGDLRSIIPKNAHVLALTGTTTPDVFDCVMKRLSLKDPVVTGLSPNRDNTTYHVEPLLAIAHLCDMFATYIRTSRTEFPKTLLNNWRMFTNVPNTKKIAW